MPALRRTGAREPIAEDGETRRYRLFEAVTRLLAYAAREAPIGAGARRPAVGGHVDRAAARPPAGRRRAGAAVRARHDPRRRRPPQRRTHRAGRAARPRRALRARRAERARRRRDAGARRGARAARSASPSSCACRTAPTATRSSSRRRCAAWPRAATTGERPGVPDGVKELIGTRLARLGETANQLLTVASVIGREFDLEVLETLVDEPEERIISALEEAVGRGAGRRGRGRRRPLRVLPRARARDPLRAPERDPPRARAPPRRAGAGGGRARDAGRDRAPVLREPPPRPRGQGGGVLGAGGRRGDGGVRLGGRRRALPARAGAVGRRRRRAALRAAARARRRGVARRRAGARWRRSARPPRWPVRTGWRSELAQAALGCTMGYAQAAAIDTEGIELLEAALELGAPTTRSRPSCRPGWPTSCTSPARASWSRR